MYANSTAGQMVFIVGQHVLVSGSITLQSLHCPFAIEKEQYSPDEQPVWYSTSHLSVRVRVRVGVRMRVRVRVRVR